MADESPKRLSDFGPDFSLPSLDDEILPSHARQRSRDSVDLLMHPVEPLPDSALLGAKKFDLFEVPQNSAFAKGVKKKKELLAQKASAAAADSPSGARPEESKEAKQPAAQTGEDDAPAGTLRPHMPEAQAPAVEKSTPKFPSDSSAMRAGSLFDMSLKETQSNPPTAKYTSNPSDAGASSAEGTDPLRMKWKEKTFHSNGSDHPSSESSQNLSFPLNFFSTESQPKIDSKDRAKSESGDLASSAGSARESLNSDESSIAARKRKSVPFSALGRFFAEGSAQIVHSFLVSDPDLSAFATSRTSFKSELDCLASDSRTLDSSLASLAKATSQSQFKCSLARSEASKSDGDASAAAEKFMSLTDAMKSTAENSQSLKMELLGAVLKFGAFIFWIGAIVKAILMYPFKKKSSSIRFVSFADAEEQFKKASEVAEKKSPSKESSAD